MNIFKLVGLTLVQLGKQVRLFPQSALASLRKIRRQGVITAREAERLDRIRNPAKYLGK